MLTNQRIYRKLRGDQGKGMADMEIKRAHRDRRPFTVVYIDLDNFK